jgi:hypothetical protein
MKGKMSQKWSITGMGYLAEGTPWPNANEKTFSQCEGVFHPKGGSAHKKERFRRLENVIRRSA